MRTATSTQLSNERETVLALAIADDANPAAQERAIHELALSALNWARVVAKSFRHHGVDRDDLESEAYFGLVAAARNFDSTRGRFAAYSTLYVKGVLTSLIARQGRAVAIPEKKHKATISAMQGKGVEGNLDFFEGLAAATAWQNTTSLNAPTNGDGGALIDLRPSQEPSAEAILGDRDASWAILGDLPAQERAVLAALYGLDGAIPLNWRVSQAWQQQVADTLGISRGRVSQLEKSGMARLRTSARVAA
jgi:RNA polymerase sigma factor (sigma-70 family)